MSENANPNGAPQQMYWTYLIHWVESPRIALESNLALIFDVRKTIMKDKMSFFNLKLSLPVL